MTVPWQIEKMPIEDIKKELRVAGIPSDAVEGILHALSLRSLSELEGLQTNIRCKLADKV